MSAKNSELKIKCVIWEKETFELIDYCNNCTMETKFLVKTPGVISRDNRKITFTPGEQKEKSPTDLITIKRNPADSRFMVDCGTWDKDLESLIEQNGAFLVYRGFSFKELNNNLNNRYYKLSQGDIIKIGRIYFKVLDIHLNSDKNSAIKNTVENTLRCTMLKSASSNNLIVNGQSIIKGAFTSKNTRNNNFFNMGYTANGNVLINKDPLFNLDQENDHRMESLDLTRKKRAKALARVNSSKELFAIIKKDKKNIVNKDKKKKEKGRKSEKKSAKPPKFDEIKKIDLNALKNKAICRICYGDDTSEQNPLICPCICKGSMKYIHYDCLKNWLNSKIEEDISVDSENQEVEVISYNRKDISCELCKEKLPDYVMIGDKYYNISFYRPKFTEFAVLESMRADNHKAKFIHIISFDKKNCINIGRANECELSISELSVSRFHCIIHKDEGDLFLEDNSSKFGTLILLQNNNLFMNDFSPLKIQTNKTFIKLKVKLPFSLSCCVNPLIAESRKYDYQLQNSKCFDILSYFIIKENDTNLEVEEDEEPGQNQGNNNKIENKNLINDGNDENKDKEKNENENEKKNEDEKFEGDERNNEQEESENGLLELNLDKKSVRSEMDKIEILGHKLHSNKLKKVNIKKGKNDSKELPELEKINLDHFKESISLIAEKEEKLSQIKTEHHDKIINLIKIKKTDKKTTFNRNGLGLTGNTGPMTSSQTIMNENSKIQTKRK